MKSPPLHHTPNSLCAILILLLLFLNPAISITKAQTDDPRGVGVSVNAWPRKAKRFALVIGVDEYQDKQITKLEGAANDAKTLADTLIQYSGFPADQVFIYTADQPLERRPTRGNILSRLSNMRSLIPKDGLLLVSFSGHGMEREGKGYLLPADAQVNGDLALLEQTAINADVIKSWIRDMGLAQVILILDACRDNPSASRGVTSKPLTETYAHRFNFDLRNREVSAFATLYATEVGQVAYEYKERKLGYFTWALVEGLKGGAADENGEVTLAKLVKYIQEAVPKRMRFELGEEKKQKPFAVIEGYKADDLVISVAGKGSLVTSAPPLDSSAVELSFWDTIKNSSNPEDFKAYLQQYPNGRFTALAKIRANPTISNQLPSTTGPGINSGTSSLDPNAITTKDIGPLRVVLKSVMRVNLNGRMGIRCAFEFINLETQRAIIIAMNAPLGLNGYLRSTLVDESGGVWSLDKSDVAGMSVVGVGMNPQTYSWYTPAEIVAALSKRDDLNSDVHNGELIVWGSTTEMLPGQSLTVTMTFVQSTNTNSASIFQMATEIVVGVARTGTKKSYTLYNLTFDRVSLSGRN